MPLPFFARSSRRNLSACDSPSAGLSEMNINSPSGPLRMAKSYGGITKNKSSPYAKGGAGRRSQRLLDMGGGSDSAGFFDDAPLLTPGRAHSMSFVADKHVILKKAADGGKIGIHFREMPKREGLVQGVVLTGIDAGSVAAASTLLVGDVITQIDGVDTSTAEAAATAVAAAKPGASLFVLARGGTREVVLDKRLGDCGMTCAAAKHTNRGVLLKRIAKGSLADVAKLYPGDTIVSVNGALVDHHQEAVTAIDQVSSLVKLVVLGESTELRIAPKDGGNKAPIGVTLADHEAGSGCAGVKVVAVVPDGRAASAGLSAGDTLLSVNGALCTDHTQAIGLLDAPATNFDETTKPILAVVQSKYQLCY